jgi:hypothetical protein
MIYMTVEMSTAIFSALSQEAKQQHTRPKKATKRNEKSLF